MDFTRFVPIFHPFANYGMRFLYHFMFKLDMQGREHAPKTGPLLIIINHTHFLDPLIPTSYLRPDVFPMAKIDLFEGKWKWMFDAYGAFPVRRGEADMQAVKHAFRLLRAGHAVLMAPEGTRAKTGGLQQAHEGVGLIASRACVPILPVALWGARDMVKGMKSLNLVTVHVRMRPPMIVQPRETKFTREDISNITDEIMCSLARMLPPECRGVYSEVEGFAPRYLVPYHGMESKASGKSEVMPLTN
ncbi:MAG: 1-acyl-sn-glycerol-3-phosphate acyltransferase [Anaerolineae bacterium]|nr:1-acyl-sn-glycerol-3-phosphate acyltransferase [Anaerolineae bacterium]